MKTKGAHLHVRVTDQLKDRFNKIANDMGLTHSDAVRRAVEEFVDKYELSSAYKLVNDAYEKACYVLYFHPHTDVEIVEEIIRNLQMVGSMIGPQFQLPLPDLDLKEHKEVIK